MKKKDVARHLVLLKDTGRYFVELRKLLKKKQKKIKFMLDAQEK